MSDDESTNESIVNDAILIDNAYLNESVDCSNSKPSRRRRSAMSDGLKIDNEHLQFDGTHTIMADQFSAAELRRQANRLVQQKRRANESEEARAKRLAAEAQSRRIARANETEEQRRERLRKNAESIRNSRAMETPEQRELRRRKMAMARRAARESETEEEKQERLKRNALARRHARSLETEEARALRRSREALARRIARANETAEQKVMRRRRAAENRKKSAESNSDNDSEGTFSHTTQGIILGDTILGAPTDQSMMDVLTMNSSMQASNAMRLARSTETKESRDKRLKLYDIANGVTYGALTLSTDEMGYYSNDEEEIKQDNVGNAESSEADRQQTFRKKFRHQINATEIMEAGQNNGGESDSCDETAYNITIIHHKPSNS